MTKVYYIMAYDKKEISAPEFKKWLKDVAEPAWRKIPGVKSVKTFHRKAGLGQRPVYQTWWEIPNFAFLDVLMEKSASPEMDKIMTKFYDSVSVFDASIVHQLE